MTDTALIRQRERDSVVASRLSQSNYRSISEVVRFGGGLREGTVRNSLKRLVERGEVLRRWEGNERYGRYVYRIA